MKIAIASSGLGHISRGIEAWAEDLGQTLHLRGLQVIVCKAAGAKQREYERIIPCWTRNSTQAKRLLDRLPSFLGWRIGLGSGYEVEQTTFTWNLIKVLRREKIDILHVQDPHVALLVQRATSLGLLRTRTILAHGTEEPLKFQKLITYLQHLAPWHLEETKASGVWKPTWTAIANFIDTDAFSSKSKPSQQSPLRQELGIPQDACVVLVAAAIKRGHKRIDYLLNEFAQAKLRSPELPLYFVIAGGWENETDELIAEGKSLLGDRVQFLVRFPRSRMADLYRSADLFVLGSLKEMMPIALLEATASGLPCLVHRHPVMEWMIGRGGRAIDMAKSGALAEAIVALTTDSRARQELGRLAREHCLTHFSKNAVVDQIVEYYSKVARVSQPINKLAI